MKAHIKISTQVNNVLLLSYEQLEGKVIVLKKLSWLKRFITQYRLFIQYRRMGMNNGLLRYSFRHGCVFVLNISDDSVCAHVKKVYEKDNRNLSLYLMEDIIFQSLTPQYHPEGDWQMILLCSKDNTYSISAFYKGFLVLKRSLNAHGTNIKNTSDADISSLQASSSLFSKEIYEELINSCHYLKRIASFPEKLVLLMINFAEDEESKDFNKELFQNVIQHLKHTQHSNNRSDSYENRSSKTHWVPHYHQEHEKESLIRGMKGIQSRTLLLPWSMWPVTLSKLCGRFFRYVSLPFCIMTGVLWGSIAGFKYVYSIPPLKEELMIQQKRPTDFYLLECLHHQQQQPFFEDFLKKIEVLISNKNTPSLFMVGRQFSHDVGSSSKINNKKYPVFYMNFDEKVSQEEIHRLQGALKEYTVSHHLSQKNASTPYDRNDRNMHAPSKITSVIKVSPK